MRHLGRGYQGRRHPLRAARDWVWREGVVLLPLLWLLLAGRLRRQTSLSAR